VRTAWRRGPGRCRWPTRGPAVIAGWLTRRRGDATRSAARNRQSTWGAIGPRSEKAPRAAPARGSRGRPARPASGQAPLVPFRPSSPDSRCLPRLAGSSRPSSSRTKLAAMSQSERERANALALKWFADHADKIRGGTRLQPAHTATTVRLERGREPVITDGRPWRQGDRHRLHRGRRLRSRRGAADGPQLARISGGGEPAAGVMPAGASHDELVRVVREHAGRLARADHG
jgi:hypothetical protein